MVYPAKSDKPNCSDPTWAPIRKVLAIFRRLRRRLVDAIQDGPLSLADVHQAHAALVFHVLGRLQIGGVAASIGVLADHHLQVIGAIFDDLVELCHSTQQPKPRDKRHRDY